MPTSLSRVSSRPRSRGRDWTALVHVPEALAVLTLVRLGLSTLGLARLRRLALPDVMPHHPAAGTDPIRMIRAVRVASRVVPFASCLTQAQGAQIMLARHGVETTVCLGVRDAADGELAAHAWLNSDGEIVLGGSSRELAGFRLLTELGATR